MENIQELREIVNPVFNTAKSCVQLDAISGDPESQQLLAILGIDELERDSARKPVPPELAEQVKKLFPVYTIYTESRFQIVNRLIEAYPGRTVVDLPCGYTARGIKMSRQGRTYYGYDLPAVIDVIGPAVAQVYGEDNRIHYASVDATNYDSLEEPIKNESGELLITTEGLLMYFTQSELEEVFSNIRRLLQKHGGSWILVDRAYFTHDLDIASAIFDNDQKNITLYANITKQAAGTVADVKFHDNVIFKGEDEEIHAFIREMGFDIREIPMDSYLPDQLGGFKSVPQAEAGVRKVFGDMYFWELTAREGSEEAPAEKAEPEDLPFAVDSEFKDGTLFVRIQGRMDTITAPELLKKFQETSGKADRIEMDVKKMSYVSSAGLRVLLMMYKSLEDKSRFKMTGISEGVREILETTGFDQFLFDGGQS